MIENKNKWESGTMGTYWLKLSDGYSVMLGTTYAEKSNRIEDAHLVAFSITRGTREKKFYAEKEEAKDIRIEGEENIFNEHQEEINKADGLKKVPKKSLEFVITQIKKAS